MTQIIISQNSNYNLLTKTNKPKSQQLHMNQTSNLMNLKLDELDKLSPLEQLSTL